MDKLYIKDEVLQKLFRVIGYSFNDKLLIQQALTHSSYANEHFQENGSRLEDNERLEFLGDSVLSLVVSTKLFKELPEKDEGEMSKMRASIVCESSLAECSRKYDINSFLLLGSGEESTGGRTRSSIIADSMEAIIGAIYLDGGLEAAKSFILDKMKDLISKGVKSYEFVDNKTFLQETLQKNGLPQAVYELIGEHGPDHNKTFSVKVCSGEFAGFGNGKSKKEAEQKAAKDLLEKSFKK